MVSNESKHTLSHSEGVTQECYLVRLEKLVRICESTSWTESYDDCFQQMVLALVENLDCDYANIYLLDVAGDNLTTYASHSLHSDFSTRDKVEVTSIPSTLGRLQDIWSLQAPIIMDYLNPHPLDEFPKNAGAPGFKSAITIPLVAGKDVIGIYNLVYKYQKKYSDAEIVYLKSIGRALGVAIERAQMSRKDVQMQILNERKYLSTEIHDNLAQSVSSMKLGAETALMLLDRGEITALRESLENLEAIGLQAVKLLREEMLTLRIPMSETEGLVTGIQETLASFTERWGIKTALSTVGVSDPAVTIQTELQILRILHESLSNVLRHARATKVAVNLRQVGRMLHMQIVDDGAGFAMESVSAERLGIRIMKERAESVGGVITIDSERGKGTTITLETPCIYW